MQCPFRYLYYYEKGNPQVTSTVIQGLLELIQTELQSENTAQDPEVDAFFASTLRYIEYQKQKTNEVGGRYAAIQT